MKNTKLIEKALELLELTSAEQRFYLSAVKTKNPRVAKIIKLSGLKKPTAYLPQLLHYTKIYLMIFGKDISCI